LRQIKRIIPNSVENKILKLVNYSEQVLAEGSHFVELKPKRAPEVIRRVVGSAVVSHAQQMRQSGKMLNNEINSMESERVDFLKVRTNVACTSKGGLRRLFTPCRCSYNFQGSMLSSPPHFAKGLGPNE
jgi:hypothetical protein